MPEPDEWLMQQVARGSTSHLDTLLRRHAQPILLFATRLLANTPHPPSRAEEALQETFLSVWQRRSTYKYPRFFRPWLFQIARNKCWQLLRPHDFLTLGIDPDTHHSSLITHHLPIDSAIATETSTLVQSALTLSPLP